MRKVSIFGATGSIGQNPIDLIKREPEAFDVVALSGGRNVRQLAEDAIALKADLAVTAHGDSAVLSNSENCSGMYVRQTHRLRGQARLVT